MKTTTTYQKVASHEAHKGKIKKCLLLYSGGLDTSVMLKWIKDAYEIPVTTLTFDLGQQNDDLEAVKQKAIELGAAQAIVVNAKKEFAEEYIAKGIKANGCYQGDYHLSTPMGRAIIGKLAAKIAAQEGADCVAHGATGKGNDQVRMESYILTHNPALKIIAPVREWDMDRNEEIEYAAKNDIPVPVSASSPYSVDDNMWGMTWEGGEIEDPSLIPPLEKFLTAHTLATQAPDEEKIITLDFEQGLPVALDKEKFALADLIVRLNKVAGQYGVGVTHLCEDRLVGLKNRGVYDMPAAHVIIAAHKALEKYVSTRQLNEIKETLDIKWAYLCYGSLWFDPAMQAINGFNDEVNKKATGEVKIKLYKGQATVVAMKSPYALSFASFNKNEGYNFNVNASAGFIEIYSLQMKLANQLAGGDGKNLVAKKNI